MLVQEVDPRKALLTLDLELIESVTATDQEKRSELYTLLNYLIYIDYAVCMLYTCISTCLQDDVHSNFFFCLPSLYSIDLMHLQL